MHETPQSTLTHTRRFFVIAISSRSGWLAVWLVVSIWWLLWFIVVQFELVNSDTIKKRSCCPFIIIIHYFFLAQIHLALRLHWMIFNVCLLFSFLLAFFRGKLWHQPQQMQFFWHLNGNVLAFIFGIKCWRAAFFSFVIRVSPVRHEKSGLNTLRWCCHVAPVVLFRLFSFKFKFHMLQMCHAHCTAYNEWNLFTLEMALWVLVRSFFSRFTFACIIKIENKTTPIKPVAAPAADYNMHRVKQRNSIEFCNPRRKQTAEYFARVFSHFVRLHVLVLLISELEHQS